MNRLLGPAVALVVLAAGSVVLRRATPRPAAPPAVQAPAPPPAAPTPAARPGPGPRPAAKPAPDAGGFDLVDVSAPSGLRFVHKKGVYPAPISNIGPWLASIGAASAVVDFDGDGRMDFYLTSTATGSLNALYRNNGDGTFSDVAAKAGLADVNTPQGSLRPLFFDFDGDGDPDLVLTTQYCTRVFRNDGGVFTETTKDAGIAHCGLAYAANALDLDGDGDLDLAIGDYFPQVDLQVPSRFDFMMDSLTEAKNGGALILYENDGRGRFTPFPDNLGVRTNGWAQSVGAWDVDGDGRTDLYVANDYNNDSLYLNKGGGRLVDASSRLENKYSRNGMNTDFADLDGDGRPSVYVTHIYEPPYKLGGNTLWTFGPGAGPARDRAKDMGVAACGWAWGAKFADLDLDGRQDLLVTNGYISANPDRSYWYRMSVLASAARTVMADARNWPPMEDDSMSGFQKKCVYRNTGGRFELVTHRTGMKDDVGDGRGLSVIDPKGDGGQAVLATYIGGPARLWKAVAPAGNAWIGFSLSGKKPRDAWGAVVTVKGGGRVQRRELEPANAFMSQSDPRLVFGLGPAGRAESVTVRWPSGAVQDLGPLPAGRYHALREP